MDSDTTAGKPTDPLPHQEGGEGTDLESHEEPETIGTVFIMIVFLMALAGMWGIMYLTLLER